MEEAEAIDRLESTSLRLQGQRHVRWRSRCQRRCGAGGWSRGLVAPWEASPDNASKEEAEEDTVAVQRLHDLRRLRQREGEGVHNSLRREHHR